MTADDEPPPDASIVELGPMRWWHLAEVADLELAVFDLDPWTPEMFWSELAQGASRHYLVALVDGRIVGYAGLAVTDEESYIQTVGVHPAHRGRRLGACLMIALLREARRRGARSCGLEVRTDNLSARALYSRLGFVDIGIRRGYYQPSGGDAYVMRVRPIDTPGYGAQLDAAWAALAQQVSEMSAGKKPQAPGRGTAATAASAAGPGGTAAPDVARAGAAPTSTPMRGVT